jgi:hypothetical protein
MVAPTLSKRALERIELHRTDQRYKTLRTVVRGGYIFGAIWVAFSALETFAGLSTNVSVVLSLALSALFETKFIISITLAGSCAVWAAAERMLRYRGIERLQGRIKELETAIDPKRSTSGLTPRGMTNPRDKKP